VDSVNFPFTAIGVLFLAGGRWQCGVEDTMTPGHDRKVAEQADRMRELSIRLLVETDPKKPRPW